MQPLLDPVVKQQLIKIRLTALNILSSREHSIKELTNKLQKKDFTANLVDKVIQDLISDDLLNEHRFTEHFIHNRVNKGQGPVKIRHELHLKGIDDALIDAYLDSSFEFWQPVIELARSKRFGKTMPLDYKEQNKQLRFLYQRGFDTEHIRRCFK